ncbi:hypothetical protein [Pectobacterium versatile]|uniref:hypothetical protein n=1 Tax=Pectobacterium versatile TaxID=2488639 RepID=UPI000F64FDD6|nr:hypothetical protein [Pectobacterium versatile]AZK63863.1 hypothetical protein EIP93_17025 [Pectobacterium versatile]TAI80325.1 hypothetical protein EG333_21940 [Pectobacterium versatile]
MRYSYRVTKYQNIDGEIYSLPDEWTSFFDVGDKVDIDEYEKVENQYIDFIVNASLFFSVDNFQLKDVELNGGVHYSNEQEVSVESVKNVVKSILREDVWCKLVSDDIEFHFGYDFYMYFLSNKNPDCFLKELNSPLTVQVYNSPYS